MNRLNTKTHFGSRILHFAVCVLLILLSACGEGSSTSFDEASSDTGSIAVSLEWEDSTSERSVIQAALFDCAGNGVDTVQATVYDQDYKRLKSGGPWACNVGSGTIKGVRAGRNRRVVVLGKDHLGDVLYQGERTGITVTAGKTTQATITMMIYVGDTLIWDQGKWDGKNWG